MLILFLLLLASPAYALPVSYQLNGVMADGGTIVGSMTYDIEAAPLAINVRNLAGNTVYAVSDYAITVAPVYGGLAPVLYQPLVGQQMEWCVGHCVFAAVDVSNLMFTDGVHRLQVTFMPNWDGFRSNSSDYRSPQPNGIDQVTIVVRSAEMVPVSVPEPATWLLLMCGVGAVTLLLRRLS